jgi:hypothetical protein
MRRFVSCGSTPPEGCAGVMTQTPTSPCRRDHALCRAMIVYALQNCPWDVPTRDFERVDFALQRFADEGQLCFMYGRVLFMCPACFEFLRNVRHDSLTLVGPMV